MAHRDRSPVHVPLRTSSRNMLRAGTIEDYEEDRFLERKTSKAQRILGTDLPLPGSNHGWDKPVKVKSRRQSLRTPDGTTKPQPTSFVPFPAGEQAVPPQNLRVRASSPLLGHNYRSQEPAPPLPKPSKKIHHTGSSSTLFSYFSSKEKDGSKSSPTTPRHSSLQPQIRNELGTNPHVTYKQAGSTAKEPKRKLRPPRIDLSILFPKPRNPAPPLLSPQRMTNSPSPVSTVVSDYPAHRVDQISSISSTKKFGDPLPPRSSVISHEGPKHTTDRSDLLSIPESKDGEWHDHPLERTVGTSEIDIALDRYAGRRSLFSRSSVYTASKEQLRIDQPQLPAESSLAARRGHSPASLQRKAPHLNPTTRQESSRHRALTTESKNSRGGKSAVSKKSSKSTLRNKDLQNSSVLCLSSSEDENESEQETPANEQGNNRKNFRDSVATYGEFEPEIYTASTAQAATAQMLKKVERAPSTSSHGSHPASRTPPNRRHTSIGSTGKSSTTTRRTAQTTQTTQSRRSSHIPIIAEPSILDQFPQQPRRTPQELKEINRRSRVIAVTRQEQDLLEAMRQRKGKITPSIFQYNTGPDTDQSSMISGPSRDSFCGSDTSFLRLSAAFPPFPARKDQGATHMDKDGSPSQSSSSDTEQKTGNSITSPRFSMGYSESLPSPATSGASPLTPTLPIHRFSPLPSPKPPPRGPPPAIPEDQKQHARRRTDSSEAIMLNDSGEPQRKHDLPLWSFDFDWNQDRTSVAPVH
ncbi:hypothetical protein N7462_008060 [Penicillium macrosclerotiorum]|uniref:uncharacterized protein n=1 Tax=Penicillium macrosclerotiorum TaxID=303699 RepID=UPI0025487FDD|nr:uncharacterized protein N7462_008060 [Penicillium macrosclerotiorum]KAJ5679816.1 hypothetical protein N7462_008060 [Penicillium macrosclerotiorum]